MEESPCRLCGGHTSVLFIAEDYNQGVAGRYTVVGCLSCLAGSTVLRREQFAVSDYPPTYVSQAINWGYLSPRIQLLIARLTGSARFLSYLGLESLSPGKLLDVGSGTGVFAKTMAGRGWKVLGLEPNPTAALQSQLSGVTVLKSELDSADLPSRSFDAITLIHVLEHVSSPRAVISTCERVLGVDGVLVVAVPNFDSPTRRFFGRLWYPLDVPRHLTHFNLESLTALLNREGFRIVDIAFDNRSEDLVRSVLNALLKSGHRRARANRWIQLVVGSAAVFLNVTLVPLLRLLRCEGRMSMVLVAERSNRSPNS